MNNGKSKNKASGVRCFAKGPAYIVGCGEAAPYDEPRNIWIIRLNFAAAVLHLILFSVLLFFVVDYDITLERALSTKIAVWERYPNTSVTSACKWDKGCANPVTEPPVIGTASDGRFRIFDTDTHYGELSLAPLVLSFSALSFVFQFARPWVGWGDLDYLEEVERRVNWIRWLEYSLSATSMILAVAFVLNIQDVGSVAMLATSTAVTQLFGLVGELMLERKNGSYREELFIPAWIAHLSGWTLQSGVFFTVFVSYFQSVEQAKIRGGEEPPAFVYAIVLSMGILFGSFGIVQFFDFIHRSFYDNDASKGCCRKRTCCDCGFVLCARGLVPSDAFELAYIFLSLTAKTLLSVLVASNLFLDMSAN